MSERGVSSAASALAGAAVSPPVARRGARSVRGVDCVQSINSDGYGGVAARLGAGRRLVVNARGNRYQLQSLASEAGPGVWVGQFLFATKAALLAKYPGDRELAAAVRRLPVKPAGLFPELVAERGRQAAAFALWNNRMDAYPWVVAQCEDWRLIVDADGLQCRLMFVMHGYFFGGLSGSNMWISSSFSPDLDTIRACVDRRSGDPFGEFSELWSSHPARFSAALARVPRFAADLELPEVVERPVSVRRQDVAKRVAGRSSVARPGPSRPKGA